MSNKKSRKRSAETIVIDGLEVNLDEPWTREELISRLTTTSSSSIQLKPTIPSEPASDLRERESS